MGAVQEGAVPPAWLCSLMARRLIEGLRGDLVAIFLFCRRQTGLWLV